MRKFSLGFILLSLLGLLAVAPFAAAQDNVVVIPAGEDVVIGVAAVLSGEGLAPLGEDIRRGVELALDDRPTVTVGDAEWGIALDVQDDQCNPEGGQAIANRFVSAPDIVGVVGPTCSSACTSAAPIFDAADYTSISGSCTAPALSESGFTSFNRAVANDNGQGVSDAEFIFNELGVTRLATIHDGSAYGEGLVTVVQQRFEELGGEVVAADAINVGDTDFRGLLEEFADADPELIFFGGFPAEAARLASQRADAGLEDTLFMGADGIQTPEFVELAGDSAEGVYVSAPIPVSSDELDAFIERYIEKYDTEPTGPFNANGYDATNMLLDAVEGVGEVDDEGNLVVDRAAFREFIRSISDFQGLTGVLNCDGTGECATADVGFFLIEDGVFTVIETGEE